MLQVARGVVYFVFMFIKLIFIQKYYLRFLRFFTLVTWEGISPAQILWLCRPLQRQKVYCSRLYKTTKSKTFFFNFLSSFFSFSFVFSIYMYYFLPFFFCIIFNIPLLSLPHLSTCSVVSSSISHNGHNGCSSSFLWFFFKSHTCSLILMMCLTLELLSLLIVRTSNLSIF